MSIVVALALLLSFIIYAKVGLGLLKGTSSIADILPILRGKQAVVHNSSEFAASTVATTISLATIIIAYFELIPQLGVWLLWTVFTTILGLGVLALSAKKIWQKMAQYDTQPSLHEFIGQEFNSPWLVTIGAICTSIGFLLIFAVELTVGARFLAKMLPDFPTWLSVPLLALVGFSYTALGGFRAVIRTDIIQMQFIWLFILAMAGYIGISYWLEPTKLALIPPSLYDFSPRSGLLAFILGIAIMNIPTHISDMSIWQRIAASSEPSTVVSGVWKSVGSTAFSWGSLVVLALLAVGLIPKVGSENLLFSLLKTASESVYGLVFIFCATLGLYGAMLSTASTQLIVVSHTLYEDLYRRSKLGSQNHKQSKGSPIRIVRIILFLSAILAVGLVELLSYSGFSIADLVFSIYGGQLALFPVILMALYKNKADLKAYKHAANWAITLGFIMGWGVAFIGKSLGESSLIFLSPCVSIFMAMFTLLVGKRNKMPTIM